VLDSTDPDAVLAAARRFEPATTLYVVSTKSGGTVETASFFKYFFNRAAEVLGVDEAGRHFVAITDPGSGLADWAKEHKFRATLLNNPNIGGRYSVLSSFGLLPAALLGIDVSRLLDRAQAMADGCRQPAPNNPGAWLGTVMGCAAKEGIDKVTFIASPAVAHFGLWVEQLIAESTGKEGLGILPVDLEPLGAPAAYRSDRLFAYLRLAGDATYDNAVTELAAAGHPVIQLDLADAYDVAAEFFRWEFATAIAGYWPWLPPTKKRGHCPYRRRCWSMTPIRSTQLLCRPAPAPPPHWVRCWRRVSAGATMFRSMPILCRRLLLTPHSPLCA
jgi:hypothetical protein